MSDSGEEVWEEEGEECCEDKGGSCEDKGGSREGEGGACEDKGEDSCEYVARLAPHKGEHQKQKWFLV